MKNKETFNQIVQSPNTIIQSVFNIGTQYNSDPLYEFVNHQLDLLDLIHLFPKLKKSKIKKAIKENRIIPFLIDNDICGWLAEVSHPHVLGIEAGNYILSTLEHCSVIYSEDYTDLIDNIINKSNKLCLSDLEKANGKVKKD